MVVKIRPIFALLLVASLCCAASFALAADEAQSDQAKEVETMVKAAAALIQQKGQAAFAEINAGGDTWCKGTTGIFVSDGAGMELVNTAKPDLVGKSVKDIPGASKTFEEEYKLAMEKGPVWYDGSWQKPDTGKLTPCRCYVMIVKADGQDYLVGGAYYLE